MELVDIAQGLEGLLKLFKDEEGINEPWARDEARFEEHFGHPYEEFALKVPELSADQHTRYEATLKVNPEAAVLWVLAMQVV